MSDPQIQTQVFDKNAEESYLGGLLIAPKYLLTNPINEDDFFIHKNRFIYRAIRQVYEREEAVDPVLVMDQIDKNGHVGEVGTIPELLGLIDNTPTALHTTKYAKIIQEKAMYRRYLDIASRIAKDALAESVHPSRYIEEITDNTIISSQMSDLHKLAEAYDAWVDERQANPTDIWGIETPFKDFNIITGGLQLYEAILFYGDSNLGKTTLILQLGLFAATINYRVDFYELEMRDFNLFEKLVAMVSGVSTRLVKRGKLDTNQRKKIQEASDYIRTLPIQISDSTSWSSMEIRADQVRKGSDRADLVLIDYLALLEDKADSDWQRVEVASKTLKKMAKSEGQCVVSISSDVKDGSIKGAKEVKFAFDDIWLMEKKSPDKNDKTITLTSTKRRNDGVFGSFDLVMLPDLPKFGTVYKGQEEEEPLPYYQK